jgi:hypothetical protein
MNSIKLISLNICNDDDLIYGTNEITESDIKNFIDYHKIEDNILITDIKKLFNSRLKTKIDDCVVVINEQSSIDYLHISIISYYIHEEKLRSIQINLGNKIRYINNLDPEIVDNFMTNKKKILINSLLKYDVDFLLLQEVDSHYVFTAEDMKTYLPKYNIISPFESIQSYKNTMIGMLNNFIIYKNTFTCIQSELKEYGTIGEFNIYGEKIMIISGRWCPLRNNTSIRLKQLELLDNDTSLKKVIFMGDTNLRNNETITTYNVSDSIVNFNFPKYYTINKNVNQYFNDDYKYVARYDRIYSAKLKLIYSNLCYNTYYDELKNIYRNSGFISDHFGLFAEFKLF